MNAIKCGNSINITPTDHGVSPTALKDRVIGRLNIKIGREHKKNIPYS